MRNAASAVLSAAILLAGISLPQLGYPGTYCQSHPSDPNCNKPPNTQCMQHPQLCQQPGGGGNQNGGVNPGVGAVRGGGGGTPGGPIDQHGAGGAGGGQGGNETGAGTAGGGSNTPGAAGGLPASALNGPSPGAANANQALIFLQMGDKKSACDYATRAVNQDPNNSVARNVAYKSCWGDVSGPGAKNPLQPQQTPESTGISGSQAKLLRSGADEPAQTAPRFDTNLEFWLKDIFEKQHLGQHKLAADRAKEALKQYPDNPDLLNQLAIALNKLGKHQEAQEAAERALKADPNSANAWANLALAKAGQGDKQGAIDALKKAAALDPAFLEALRRAQAGDLAGMLGGDAEAKARREKIKVAAAGGGLLSLALAVLGWAWKWAKSPAAARIKTFVRITPPPPMPGAAGAPTVLDGATKKTGKLLDGRYELGAQIGMGGMGEVFAGTDRSLERKVAVKKMLPQLAVVPKERARFVSEAKTVAALHHPNIVDIHAIVEDGSDIYLVFEFVAGKTLRDHALARGGKLPFHEAVKIIRGVAAALDFAHSKETVHRDLKPANIMIDEHGMVKVMDFGLARSAQDAMSKLAMTNTVVGTPAYMAPEQDSGVICKQSDVYALGVTLYELLSGRLPFDGGSGAMMMQKLASNFPPISQAAPGLPEGLDQFFAQALASDYHARTASVKGFMAALDALTTPSPA